MEGLLHELHINLHYILHNTVSKWVGNTASILAYIFNSAPVQCCEVGGSQSLFLHNLKYTVLSEACIYGHFNWSLVLT